MERAALFLLFLKQSKFEPNFAYLSLRGDSNWLAKTISNGNATKREAKMATFVRATSCYIFDGVFILYIVMLES